MVFYSTCVLCSDHTCLGCPPKDRQLFHLVFTDASTRHVVYYSKKKNIAHKIYSIDYKMIRQHQTGMIHITGQNQKLWNRGLGKNVSNMNVW